MSTSQWKVPRDTSRFSDDQLKRLFPMSPWAHQMRSLRGVLDLLSRDQATTFCLPTGGGKSLVNAALINLCRAYGMSVTLYSNRKLLTRQTSDGLVKSGIDHGVRAASMPMLEDSGQSVQISSIQTEIARCIKGDQALHRSDLVIVDEAHMFGGSDSLKVIQSHLTDGAKVVLVSATPVGLNHIAPRVFVGATNSELLACNSHVKAIVKSLDEMDVSRVKRVKETYDVNSIVKESWSQAIVGKVYENYNRFNPDRRMALGVAPGVPESRALAQDFYRKGVRAAHIDATEVWVDGEYHRDNAGGSHRNEVLQRWREGDIQVVFNCQVLREAVDFPSLYHLILATPICSLKDYLQQVGRVIRWSPETSDHVIVQDHGGNCINHGHPNDDHDWNALYNLTEKEIRESEDKRRDQQKPEEVPAVCPKCGTTLAHGRCPPEPMGCGEDILKTNPRKLRYVIQKSGELVELDQLAVRKKKREQDARRKSVSVEQKQWNAIFFGTLRTNRANSATFKQLRYLYFKEHKSWPPKNLVHMPIHESDFSRKIKSVSREDMRQEQHD